MTPTSISLTTNSPNPRKQRTYRMMARLEMNQATITKMVNKMIYAGSKMPPVKRTPPALTA